MKHILIIVDMQKDFVDGALGTPEAQAIAPRVCERIRTHDGALIATYDTHPEHYMQTNEGSHLPVAHCIKGTDGWQLDARVSQALDGRDYIAIEKPTFGSVALPALVRELAGDEAFDIELIGLCTDICVISNAMLLKAYLPEVPIAVDAKCCAGVTPASHANALEAMKMCQITVK